MSVINVATSMGQNADVAKQLAQVLNQESQPPMAYPLQDITNQMPISPPFPYPPPPPCNGGVQLEGMMHENVHPVSHNMDVMGQIPQGMPVYGTAPPIHAPPIHAPPIADPKAESWEQTRRAFNRRVLGSAASSTPRSERGGMYAVGGDQVGRIKKLPKPRSRDDYDPVYPNELTLEMLEEGIPAKQIAIIRQVLTPVTTTLDPIPCFGDLSWFWDTTEEGIKSLGREIRPENLASIHIKSLMRYILGPAAQIFDHRQFTDWDTFKTMVNLKFCMTKEQQENQFFDKRPGASENIFDFINKIEQERLRLNIDPASCLRAFQPFFPDEFKKMLQQSLASKVLIDTFSGKHQPGMAALSWDAVAKLAANAKPGSQLRGGTGAEWMQPKKVKHQQVFKDTWTAPAQRTVMVDPVFTTREATDKKPQEKNFYPRECKICNKLGINNTNHDTSNCFANIRDNTDFKARIFATRFDQAKKMGIYIPELYPKAEGEGQLVPSEEPSADRQMVTRSVGEFQAFVQDIIKCQDANDVDAATALSDMLAEHMNIQVEGLDKLAVDTDQVNMFRSKPDSICMFREATPGNPDFIGVTKVEAENAKTEYRKHLEQFGITNQQELLDMINTVKELDLQAYDVGDSEMVHADDDAEEGESEAEGSVEDEDEENSEVDESEMALAEIVKQQIAKQMEAKSKRVPKKSKAKKTKSAGNSALLPAKIKRGPTIAEAFSRLKLNLTLAEVMMVKPEVHEAMELLVADIAVRTNRPIMTVEGIATQMISQESLQNRCATATYAKLNGFETSMNSQPALSKPITEVAQNTQASTSMLSKRKNKGLAVVERNMLFKQFLQGLNKSEMGSLVRAFDSDNNAPDKIFLNKPPSKISKAPVGSRTMPEWVGKDVVNYRGLVPPSTSHYMALVKLGQGVCEAIIDTGGARSLIDLDTAKTLKLEIELASKNDMGCFWGPGGEVMGYAGRIKGPIRFQLSGSVYLEAPELKVIKHAEPILIIGTDVLVDSSNDWRFVSVGIHPEFNKGMLVVQDKEKVEQCIELVGWPSPVNGEGDRIGKKLVFPNVALVDAVNMFHSGKAVNTYTGSNINPVQALLDKPDKTANFVQREKTQRLKIPEDAVRDFFARVGSNLGQRLLLSPQL